MTRLVALRSLFFPSLVFAVLTGCSKTTPEPERTTESPSRASTASTSSVAPARAASAASAADPDDIGWEAPPAWTSMPNANTMRKATYKIPRAPGDSEDGELTISAASGGAAANIQRWAGQFGSAEPKTEPRTVNGLKLTLVELKGTFASGGMMGGPTTSKEKFMLLGAVVEGKDRQHFFKLTGPEKTITAAKKDFDAFVGTLRAK